MDNHMGGACSKHGKNKYSYVQNLFVNPDHLEDLSIDGRILLKRKDKEG
jgi:hypothetical protein